MIRKVVQFTPVPSQIAHSPYTIKSVKFTNVSPEDYTLKIRYETFKDRLLNWLGCCGVTTTTYKLECRRGKVGQYFIKRTQITKSPIDLETLKSIFQQGLRVLSGQSQIQKSPSKTLLIEAPPAMRVKSRPGDGLTGSSSGAIAGAPLDLAARIQRIQRNLQIIGVQVPEEVAALSDIPKLKALRHIFSQDAVSDRYKTLLSLQNFTYIADLFLDSENIVRLQQSVQHYDGLLNWVQGNAIPVSQLDETTWAQTKDKILKEMNAIRPLLLEKLQENIRGLAKFLERPKFLFSNHTISYVGNKERAKLSHPQNFSNIHSAAKFVQKAFAVERSFFSTLQKYLASTIKLLKNDESVKEYFVNVQENTLTFQEQTLLLESFRLFEQSRLACKNKESRSPEKLKLYVDKMLWCTHYCSGEEIKHYEGLLKAMQPGYLGLKKAKMTHEALMEAHSYLIGKLDDSYFIVALANTYMAFYVTHLTQK